MEQQSYLPPPEHAAKLFPHNEYLQKEWRRAVGVVRSTRRGWLLDSTVTRKKSS
jgi:hypothetical protein